MLKKRIVYNLGIINIFILGILILLPSCVSSRKYNQVASEMARLRLDSTMQAKEKADLEYQITNEILEKERIIRERNDEIRRLKASLNAREDRIKETNEIIYEIFPSISNKDIETYESGGLLHVGFGHNVLFNKGEDVLSDHGKRVIRELSNSLHTLESDIVVLGHTDSIPYLTSKMDNWELSFNRAHSVMEVMLNNGVPADRIIVAGRGKYDPKVNNSSSLGRLINRRIEIILMPDLDQFQTFLREEAE